MNRGSPGSIASACAGPRGFNEAPIHESGKSEDADLEAGVQSRFNEAPIHESGK